MSDLSKLTDLLAEPGKPGPHEAKLVPDDQFPHLAQVVCSCGFHTAGFTMWVLAKKIAFRHVGPDGTVLEPATGGGS